MSRSPALFSRQVASGQAVYAFTLVRRDDKDGIATLTIDRPDAHERAGTRRSWDSSASAFRAAAGGSQRARGRPRRQRQGVHRRRRHPLLRQEHGSRRTIRSHRDLHEGGTGIWLLEFQRRPESPLSRACRTRARRRRRIGARLPLHRRHAESDVRVPGSRDRDSSRTRRHTTDDRERVGRGLAKASRFTGDMITAEQALAIGLVDRVVPARRISTRQSVTAGVAKVARAAHCARTRSARSPRDTSRRTSTRCARSDKRVGFKAPIALRIASDLIDRGAGKPIEQGLAMELSHLEEVRAQPLTPTKGCRVSGQATSRFQGAVVRDVSDLACFGRGRSSRCPYPAVHARLPHKPAWAARPPAPKSPEIHPDHTVTWACFAPKAQEVPLQRQLGQRHQPADDERRSGRVVDDDRPDGAAALGLLVRRRRRQGTRSEQRRDAARRIALRQPADDPPVPES